MKHSTLHSIKNMKHLQTNQDNFLCLLHRYLMLQTTKNEHTITSSIQKLHLEKSKQQILQYRKKHRNKAKPNWILYNKLQQRSCLTKVTCGIICGSRTDRKASFLSALLLRKIAPHCTNTLFDSFSHAKKQRLLSPTENKRETRQLLH